MNTVFLKPVEPSDGWVFLAEWPPASKCFPAVMCREGTIRFAMVKPDAVSSEGAVILGKRFEAERDSDVTTARQIDALVPRAKKLLAELRGKTDEETESLAKWWGENPSLFEAATGRAVTVDDNEKLKVRIVAKWKMWTANEFKDRYPNITQTAGRLEDLKLTYPGEYASLSETNFKKICSDLGLSKA